MQKKIFQILIAMIFIFYNTLKAQTSVTIPAYTAYAVPAEQSIEESESNMFTKQSGIQNWTDSKQNIEFFFNIRTKGILHLALLIKNDIPGNKLSATIAGKRFLLSVPGSKNFVTVNIGSVNIVDTGFYLLTLSSIVLKGKTIAEIKSLELNGTAVKNIHFNANSRRNAASVHLFYPIPDSMKAINFYNEITIPQNADVLHSYYMACGFTRGYLGIQVNSTTERRVIFSIWDAGNEAVDRNKVAPENKVQLLAKGEDVYADGFGNEGTGGHSHWVYNWKAGETYKFLVTAATDSASLSTSYAGYFFIPEIQRWKLIACFKAPKDGKPLKRLYSFVENFDGSNGQLYRKAFFSNPLVRRQNGEWNELTQCTFSYDATGKAGDRIDYGGGIDSNQFYLWNGGFKSADAKFGDVFLRNPSKLKPLIDLYKNADSEIEAVKEKELILESIRSGKTDTTGSLNGVYYSILQEGKGDLISVNDTLIVHYKGTLLNGNIFDQSKEEPASLPLKRLIKGWQIGMPFCREGGKIRLIIPSYLAYSIRNISEIPPNNPLIFDIEVIQVKKGR